MQPRNYAPGIPGAKGNGAEPPRGMGLAVARRGSPKADPSIGQKRTGFWPPSCILMPLERPSVPGFTAMRPTPLSVSVIVPVHNGGAAFRACVEALAVALGPSDELIVVADGETDGAWRGLPTTEAAVETVVRRVSGGPAAARNDGARRATGDVLFFVDADVVVPPTAVDHVRRQFAADPEVAALVGSYDAHPADPAFLSQYRNLLHHHTHQAADPSAFSTFWTGCGAVRRSAFLRLGGFDERYGVPCVEDIEFGYRLAEAGDGVLLDATLQVTHLKAWGALDMLRTDTLKRAAPWTELLLRRGAVEDSLNVDWRSRASLLAVALLGVALGLAVVSPTSALLLATGAAGVFGALNASFYRYLGAIRGPWFAARAIPWHAAYYVCAGLGFAVGATRHVLRPRPAFEPAIVAD